MRTTAGDPSNQSPDRPAIDDDIGLQRRIWRFERVGWAVMGLFILAALAGLFGPGPLSTTEVSQGPLHLEYERFQRHQSPTALKVRIDKSAIAGDSFSLVLNGGFTDEFQIEKIVPMPEQWQLTPEGAKLRFLVGNLESTGTVHLYLKPQGFGSTQAAIGLDGEPPVALQQFVHP